jgi:hypothetical protein
MVRSNALGGLFGLKKREKPQLRFRSWGFLVAKRIGRLNFLVNFGFHERLGLCAHDAAYFVTTFEQNESRDATDVEIGGYLGVVVHVHFGDGDLVAVLRRQFVEYGIHHFAGATPLSPKIYHGEFIALEHVLLESCIRKLQCHFFKKIKV